MKKYQSNPVAVVVNSGDSNGYGVIVNLGRQGIPVWSVDSNPQNITFFSKYAKKIICPDYERSEEEFIDFLLGVGKFLSPKPVLFVTGDLQLLVVLKYREKLEDYFHLPMASLDVVEKLVDKVKFYEILKEFKVPHATTYVPETAAQVEELSNQLLYPYIIKPVQSKFFSQKFGNKCLEANSPEELIQQYKKVAQEEDKVIIQKQLAGTERYLVYTYFNSNSQALAVTCYKKLRIQPMDYGNASMCRIKWEPAAIRLCLQVLKKLNYKGLAEAEIQLDKNDGEFKLTEINARSTTQTRLSARYGMNMEYIAYQDTLGHNPKMKASTLSNLIWVDIIKDILGVFSSDGYFMQGKICLKKWLCSFKGKKEYAFAAWDDPIPFFILLFRFLKLYGLNKNNVLMLFTKKIS